MKGVLQVPVLAYHASHIDGVSYTDNDHVALAQDLATLTALGWRVVPLSWVVDQRLGSDERDLRRCVALTCDDGTVLDVADVDLPDIGPVRGFVGCLADATGQPDAHITSFVIADPLVRSRLDAQCLRGLGWMGEDWWPSAATSGRLAIECHSWDHNHPVLDACVEHGMTRGDFFQIDSEPRARLEVDQAVAYLNDRIAPSTCSLFAYPYGHASDFLRRDYLPAHGRRLGLRAAFGVRGEPVTMASDPWCLPRFVCGWHWRTPGELAAILDGIGAS